MSKDKEIKTETNENVVNEKPKTKMSKWLIVLIVIGCLYYIVPLGLFAFAMVTDTFTTEYKVLDDGSINIDKGKLTIQANTKGYYNQEKGAYYIEGKVTNNTDKDYNGIDIRYYLYNEDGEILGDASTYIQKLDAKKTWNFKVIYEEVDAESVAKYEYNPSY